MISAPVPSWVQRLFQMKINAKWTVEFDRNDVNHVLDHLETSCTDEEATALALELGRFLLQQMASFRHSHDILTLEEMAEEQWGEKE